MLPRRSLLAAMAGSLVLGGRTLAATRALPKLSFCVVSDTHLGRKESPTPQRQWEQAISEINGLDATFVLHLGDVVDGGREEIYPIYAQSRKELNKPIYEIPGNHDPQEVFARNIREQIDTSFEHDGIRFVLFNNSDTASHMGFIKPPQLKWLANECEAAAHADQFLILACHVPIHANRHPDRGWYVKPMDGQTEFYALQERHRDRMLLLLHGHFHNGIRGWTDHNPCIECCVPSNCYNQDRKLISQQAPGFVVDELRPGYVIATLAEGKLRLDYKPLKADPAAHFEAAIVDRP